jgi:hypothetical protein
MGVLDVRKEGIELDNGGTVRDRTAGRPARATSTTGSS